MTDERDLPPKCKALQMNDGNHNGEVERKLFIFGVSKLPPLSALEHDPNNQARKDRQTSAHARQEEHGRGHGVRCL